MKFQMGKVRRLKKLPEDSNLNRFKNYVNQFTSENEGRFPEHGQPLKVKKELSRKEQRKAERKFKKFKKHAFKQKIPIPTKESLEKEKKEKEAEKEKQKQVENKERKKKQKKKAKKRKLEKKKEEEEFRKRSLIEANKFEDREIKKYEKLLRLNKRKSKSISLGFRNEGLDFLLEAVDKDKLKELMETGEELESAEMALNIDQDSGSDQDDFASGQEYSASDQDNSGSDESDSGEFNIDSENLDLHLEVGSQSGSELDNNNGIIRNEKEIMIDEIMNSVLTGKKVKNKVVKDGKRKTVTFNDEVEETQENVSKKKKKESVEEINFSSFEMAIKERLSKTKLQKEHGNVEELDSTAKKEKSFSDEEMNSSFESDIKGKLSKKKQKETGNSPKEKISKNKKYERAESNEEVNSSFESEIKERLLRKKQKETENLTEENDKKKKESVDQSKEINSSFEREIKERLSKKKQKETGNSYEENDSKKKKKHVESIEEVNSSFESEIKERLSKKEQKHTGNAVGESDSSVKKDKNKKNSQVEEMNSSFEREIKERLSKKKQKEMGNIVERIESSDSNEHIYEPTDSDDMESDDMSDESDELPFVNLKRNKEKLKTVIDAKETNHSGSEESIDKDDDDSQSEQSEDEGPKYTEDIYGRLRDEKGNIVDSKTLKSSKDSSKSSGGAYVPPAKRLALATDMDEKKRLEIERMKKQLKGLVNRLSEGNMQSVASQIEEMFRCHSRAETCEALTEIIMGACDSSFLVPERLMMEHCMLIAILHGNVGSEVGANFLQYFAQKFKSMFHNDEYQTGKEMDNLVMLLANLYNFKIVHSLLVFDVMKKFAEKFGERDIEILLVILKNVGFTLRKDDPASLKDFIVQIQNKASSVDTAKFQEKSKVQFMLEIILHIKNNNMRKIPNYDPSHLDHLKKLLRNYIKGSSSADFQLRISLEDLLQAEEQGKWWIVGSAWTGRDRSSTANTVSDNASTSSVGKVSEKILELARKQRMNTDVRKNIFCVIMTSEDFVDAFEKLLRLGLKHQQEREIIHVIVDLCLQEKTFNPFYAYLLQKFCEYDRRFQMTLQFNIWDKFKESSSLGDQRLDHLSKLLTHLIATSAMSLSVFKVLEFSELDKHRVRIMKKTLSAILLEYDEHITRETFSRIAPLQKLQTLREGLKLFMSHFLLKKKRKDSTSHDTENEFLTERVGIAEKALNSGESQLRM